MSLVIEQEFLAALVFKHEILPGWDYELVLNQYRKGGLVVTLEDINRFLADRTCAVCLDGPDQDIRWLRIGMFYDLHEVSSKLRRNEEDNLFELPFCKACRKHLMFEVLAPWLAGGGSKQDPRYAGHGGNVLLNPEVLEGDQEGGQG